MTGLQLLLGKQRERKGKRNNILEEEEKGDDQGRRETHTIIRKPSGGKKR